MKTILNWEQFNEKKEIDPKAEIRNRGKVVFDSECTKVTDNKDHFPINDVAQARNALARASQYKSVPTWYKGTLEELVKRVQNKVKKEYPSIEVTEKSEKLGKN